jgi:hypothetical protein
MGKSCKSPRHTLALGDIMEIIPEFTPEDVASAWINVQKSKFLGELCKESDLDLSEKIFLGMDEDPIFSWKCIKNIILIAENNKEISANYGIFNNIIGMLGAGDIENLVESHGIDVIDDMERFALAHPILGKVLSFTWEGRTPKDIWQRIEVIKDK